MALTDYELTFSDAQVVTTSAMSTNIVDRGAASRLASGTPLNLIVKIGTISGTSPTLTLTLQGSVDVAFTAPVTISTLTPTIAASQADVLLHFGMAALTTGYRYYRMSYTTGGTTPSVVITAGMGLNESTAPST
jgi:hypothetical protein